MVRVRFAPSPTGLMHMGNVRTALFNWLFAKNKGGVFILRIEDTDQARSRPEYTTRLVEDLRWLGIDWQEGPEIGGPFGSYLQSERLEIYREFCEQLKGQNLAYPCFCSPEDLERRRKLALAAGKKPGYDNRCRNLSPEERAAKEREGTPFSFRFRVPKTEVVFQDQIRGRVKFHSSQMPDLVILKADGTPTYHFAVVVDDALMKVTHVLRGEDHITNTPYHILLFQALGFESPQFGHFPNILGSDGKKYSKRHGATSIEEFKNMGYLPKALANFLALLGWSPKDNREKLSIEEIIGLFSLSGVNRSPAIFDFQKLNWLNSQYIKEENLEDLAEMLLPFLRKEEFWKEENRPENLPEMVDAVRDHLHRLDEIGPHISIFFHEGLPGVEERKNLVSEEWRKVLAPFLERLRELDPLARESFHRTVVKLGKELGIQGKRLYFPIRVALTGSTTGPEMDRIAVIFGKAKCVKRVERALRMKE